MKNILKRLLRKRPKRVVIYFEEMPDGSINTYTRMDRGVKVSYLLVALDKMKYTVQTGLTNKAHAAGLNYKHSQTRSFISKQTLGDVL